jgi:hypothetical protein
MEPKLCRRLPQSTSCGFLTTMLHCCGHEASEWPQLYQQDTDFATTYHLLGTCMNVTNFHIQDKFLFHLDHLCVPTSECAKLIWDAHYNRMVGHFGVEKTSISNLPLHVPLPSHPSRSKDYTPLFLLLRGLGNPSQWITCLAFHRPRKAMIVYLWWLIGFQRWSFSQPARRALQWKILSISSLNECGSILGYHKPSSMIGTAGSSAHFSQVYGHFWTTISLNPLPSTLKSMAIHKSLIG